jgi:hypothetical protein
VKHLFGAPASVLPETRGAFLGCAVEGLRAIVVIFAYLAPLYAVAFALVLSRGWRPGPLAFGLAACFGLYPIFSTLSLPTALALFAASDRAWLEPAEAAALFSGYVLLIFLVPAGFLRVSLTGRYRSAFDLSRSLPLLWLHRRAYGEAWLTSGMMGLLGHCAVPVAPWGVAWCYLGIIVTFNEILLAGPDDARPREDAGFRRLLQDARFAGRGEPGFASVADASGAPARILDLGRFSVPLPRLPWPPRLPRLPPGSGAAT